MAIRQLKIASSMKFNNLHFLVRYPLKALCLIIGIVVAMVDKFSLTNPTEATKLGILVR